MARKVFISVLGSTNYGTCKYEFKEKGFLSDEVRFVQEATLKMLEAKRWEANSAGFICVTEGERGSLNVNWKDNGHKDLTSGCFIQCEGLKSRINNLNLQFDIKPIKIKEGNSKEEIWEVFDAVFKLLQNEDQIYFDITHGFRYLPMLILVLSNYAKFLKNIQVKSITYGNYEARDKNSKIAPIIDITSFSVLQDWTSAADNLINYADGKKLSQVVKSDIKHFFTSENEKREEAKALNSAVNSMLGFTNSLIYVKGADIYNALNIDKIQQSLDIVANSNAVPQLTPILERIESKIVKFQTKPDINNVLEAVDWSIMSGLIQQAHSILYEGIITYILLSINEMDIYNVDKRMAISASYTIIQKNNVKNVDEWKSLSAKKYPELIRKCKTLGFVQKYCMEMVELGDRRNFLMHARYRNENENNKIYSDKSLIDFIDKLNLRFKKFFNNN